MIARPLILDLLRDPARAAAFSLADWDLALRQAAATRLEASVSAMLDDLGLSAGLPAPVADHLSWACVHAARHAQAVRWELAKIAQALAQLAGPVVVLKGGAYGLARLAAGRGRIFSDIDILVPKDQLGPAEAALMMHGWATTHHDEYDQRYYRNWMHELPPMKHMLRATVIDVHHAILPETARTRPDPALLLQGARLPDGADVSGLRVLAPVDMVIHSAVHLFHEGELDHGLRDLLDLHRLLGEFGASAAFWPALQARAVQLDSTRVVFYALRYCAKMLGTAIPAALLNAPQGRPNPLLLALMDALFARALLPNHPSCRDWFSAPARFLLYLRGNWLRMPPLMLARHLAHKAFLSPKKPPDDVKPPE